MKTIQLFFFGLILVVIAFYSCKKEQGNHEYLIQWIEENRDKMGFSDTTSEKIMDDKIISTLTSIAEYNYHFDSILPVDLSERNFQEFISKSIDLSKYLDQSNILMVDSTAPIGRTRASGYYNNYITARTNAASGTVGDVIKKDKTEAALFTMPHIINGLIEVFQPSPNDWVDTAWWNDKGLIVFPANYGATGDSLQNYKWQSTFIIQLAEDTFDTKPGLDNWRVKNRMYNYGDLKPPKLRITNENDTPK